VVETLSTFEALERVALAMAVGALLGLEREWLDRPAGLRTYMLVVEGSCLFMVCAIMISQQMALSGQVSDPGRIASTVVQGIGFIAAGVIITTGRQILGLTTAAGIWVGAAIGLIIGAGFYAVAIVATAATITALVALRQVEKRVLGTKPGPKREPQIESD
jgi:putative Mg2+ transporter-C (MgtC) family protein